MVNRIKSPLPDRIRLWSLLLTLLSLEDLGLTLLALRSIPSAREINPLPSIALRNGVLAATLLKLIGIAIAICAAAFLARRGHEARVHKTLVAWSAFYLTLNSISAFTIVGGF